MHLSLQQLTLGHHLYPKDLWGVRMLDTVREGGMNNLYKIEKTVAGTTEKNTWACSEHVKVSIVWEGSWLVYNLNQHVPIFTWPSCACISSAGAAPIYLDRNDHLNSTQNTHRRLFAKSKKVSKTATSEKLQYSCICSITLFNVIDMSLSLQTNNLAHNYIVKQLATLHLASCDLSWHVREVPAAQLVWSWLVCFTPELLCKMLLSQEVSRYFVQGFAKGVLFLWL